MCLKIYTGEMKMIFKETDSITKIRITMSILGWASADSITNVGWGKKYGYSIWFSRWDWQGVKMNKICIHGHTEDLTEEGIQRVIFNTAQKAYEASTTFTHSVPTQLADGSLIADSIQTPFFQKALKEGYCK